MDKEIPCLDIYLRFHPHKARASDPIWRSPKFFCGVVIVPAIFSSRELFVFALTCFRFHLAKLEPGLCGQSLCGAFAGKPTNGTPLNVKEQGPTVTQSNSTPIRWVFRTPITRPHTPITQQLCLRLYFDGLPLSLMRVHVKDWPKIGELLQIYDNLLLAHLM